MHTRLKLLLTALAIIGPVVLFSWSHRPPEKRLLKLATKVASLSESNRPPYLHYLWLTDHELLVFRSVEAGQWQGFRQDVAAHSERPLTALTALLRRTKGLPWTVKPSPDGKWLLWEGAGKFIYAVTVEGTSFRRWPYGREERREDMGYSLWLADCSHFARITQHLSAKYGVVTRVTVRDIDRPETLHSVRYMEQDIEPNAGVSIVFPAGDRVYADVQPCTPDCNSVNALGLGADQAEVYHIPVKLPANSEVFFDHTNAPFDSEGERMLWRLSTEHQPTSPAWSKWLGRFFPISSRPWLTKGLWVSHVDGSGMHEIGNWAEDDVSGDSLDADMEKETKPEDFRWVPGGKLLSFEYRGALYTVPAN